MSAYKKQIGGKHYLKYKVQPSKFVGENKLLYPEEKKEEIKPTTNTWGIIK